MNLYPYISSWVRTSNSGTSAEGAGDGASAAATGAAAGAGEGEAAEGASSIAACSLVASAGAPDAGAAAVGLPLRAPGGQLRMFPGVRARRRIEQRPAQFGADDDAVQRDRALGDAPRQGRRS